MKLCVLVDNCTLIGTGALGEPGYSVYMEDGDTRLLLDTGETGILTKNARAFGVDLDGLDYVVLSHGHFDHCNGLPTLWAEADVRETTLLLHPDALLPKRKGERLNGACFTPEEAAAHMRVQYRREPLQLTERLWFLGEIPRVTDFEAQRTGWERKRAGVWEADLMTDDTALAYRSDEGVFVVTGCSHSGICNILTHAARVCGDDRIRGVLGGFHLLETGPQLDRTAEWLREKQIPMLCPCHCVSLFGKIALANRTPIREIGVGTRIEVS